MLRVRYMSGHVIVCGLGRQGSRFAQAFCREGYRVIGIDLDADNPQLDRCREEGVVAVVMDATQREALVKMRADQAKYLVATCGDEGVNAEVAVRAREVSQGRRRGALTCFVSLQEPEVCELLREKEFLSEHEPGFRLEFFSLLERGARSLLAAYPPWAGAQVGQGQSPVHLLVVGLGRLGESLIVHAAREWRFARRDREARLRVTVVDCQATALRDALLVRCPDLADAAELVAVDMDVRSSEFGQGSFLSEGTVGCDVDMIYVCLADDSMGLSAALALHRQCHLRGARVPIVVRMSDQIGLAELLSEGAPGEGEFGNLRAFALLDKACNPEALTLGVNESLARSLHEVYLQGQQPRDVDSAASPSMRPWEELPEDIKEANREQAAQVARILAQHGFRAVPRQQAAGSGAEFSEEKVEEMACAEHERWCKERSRAGYRYGLKRDDRRKVHPDLVKWEDLCEESKEKCRRAIRGLPSALDRLGFQIERAEPVGPSSGLRDRGMTGEE